MRLLLAAIPVLALGLAAAWFQTGSISPRGPLTPSKAFVRLDPPVAILDLALVDGRGAPVELGRYRGKALLINLWATWCAPCVAELPSLARLEALRGGPDFAVLPIAVDERDPAKVAAFLARYQVALPTIVDLGRGIDRILKVRALPTSLLVDRDGLARAIFIGDTRWDCGRPLEAVSGFVASGAIEVRTLTPCE